MWGAGVKPLLAISIPGEPVGKGRPRLSTRGGFARAYTPAKTATWEGNAAALIHAAWDKSPLDEPLLLVVRAIKARPKAMPKRTPSWRLWRTVKPDGDNVLKCVGDALVSAGVLVDDTRIVEWRCLCLYAARDEGPSVEIELHWPHPLDSACDRRLYGANGGAE